MKNKFKLTGDEVLINLKIARENSIQYLHRLLEHSEHIRRRFPDHISCHVEIRMLMQDGVRGGKGRVFADVNFAESKAKSY